MHLLELLPIETAVEGKWKESSMNFEDREDGKDSEDSRYSIEMIVI